MNARQIEQKIQTIATNRTKLVDLIQATALAVVLHAHQHGDITLANKLCAAVGAGMKSQALRVWLGEFGPMKANAKGEEQAMQYDKAKRKEGDELSDLMSAAALKAWYDYNTEKAAEEFSLGAALHALLAKVSKVDAAKFSKEEQDAIASLHTMGTKLPKPTRKATIGA